MSLPPIDKDLMGPHYKAPSRSPSAAPVPKVWASSAGAGLGGAGGAVVVWALQSAGVDVPVEAAVAISTFISIIASFVGGYLTPPRGGE